MVPYRLVPEKTRQCGGKARFHPGKIRGRPGGPRGRLGIREGSRPDAISEEQVVEPEEPGRRRRGYDQSQSCRHRRPNTSRKRRAGWSPQCSL